MKRSHYTIHAAVIRYDVDNAEPSGNSVAIMDLVRLREITGEAGYRQKAEQSLAYFGQIIQREPVSPMMLQAVSHLLSP